MSELTKSLGLIVKYGKFFLAGTDSTLVCQLMVDLNAVKAVTSIGFFTDASGNFSLGFGRKFEDEWFFGQWDTLFMKENTPSIVYLELSDLTAGILIWSEKLRNKRIVVHCDNQSVVQMINNTSSSCRNCMYLI